MIGMARPSFTINGRPPIESVTPGHPVDHLTETVSFSWRPVSCYLALDDAEDFTDSTVMPFSLTAECWQTGAAATL